MSPLRRLYPPDLTYQEWHRPASIGRFLNAKAAATLDYFDLDGIECCHWCKQPLGLVETARWAKTDKATVMLEALARRANLPAFLLLYRATEDGDIDRFRVRRLFPARESSLRILSPAEWAGDLAHMRDWHERTECARRREAS